MDDGEDEMVWLVASLFAMEAQAQDCVWADGDAVGSLGEAVEYGASNVEIRCEHMEEGFYYLGLSDRGELHVTIHMGAALHLCPAPYGIPRGPLEVKGSKLVIRGPGELFIDVPAHSVDIGRNAEVELTGAQIRRYGDCSVDRRGFYFEMPLLDVRGDLILDGGSVKGGFAESGGGALVGTGGSLTATATTFEDNLAFWEGGAIHTEGRLKLTDVVFRNNSAYQGGAVSVAGDDDVEIRGGAFEGNEALYGGGILHREGRELLVSDVDFVGNRATVGALFPFANYTEAYDGFPAGGAIFSEGDLVVERSTFVDNEADFGSGLVIGGRSSVSDSSLRDNQGVAMEVLPGSDEVELEGLRFENNAPSDSGLPVSDLLVKEEAKVDGGSLVLCAGEASGTRVHTFPEARVALTGVLGIVAGPFSDGPGELIVDHGTLVGATPEVGELFRTPAEVSRSILQAPGLVLGPVVTVDDSLVDLNGQVGGPGVLRGPAWWIAAPEGASDCDPARYRPYPGTAGTFEPGAGIPDPTDLSDDWGAFGHAGPWTWPVHESDEARDIRSDGSDGDGAPWVLDCDDEDAARSALHDETCEAAIDANCDGVVGVPGSPVEDWWVDRDLDGLADVFRSCQEPPWSVDPDGVDCDDFDPDGPVGKLGWVDCDGDGVPVKWVICGDLPPGCEPVAEWDDEPDCDDGDGDVYRMGFVLVDEDADEVPADPIYENGGQDCVGDRLVPPNGQFDCDDADGTIYPGADDVPDDGVDQDCDGAEATSYAVGGCATARPRGAVWGFARRR